MSEIYYWEKCPKCKAENAGYIGYPELGGYVGDQATCSKCKTIFKIVIELKEIKKNSKFNN